ncbi:DNA-formamidopyrimidine glycosylase family protein [Aeromicrobium sp. CTD01-1L150]|uniref:DNA-formamidopyrimidine glycosylase family protein n=1 Tax=Aeromicrobium sp. CTD01-1L150 TaxID=3341830 RepID=UPI0035C0EB31
MPEGDTVWRAAAGLRTALASRVLTRCDVRVPAHATVDLSGTTVDEVLSRGKHLLIRAGDVSIHSHLAMEGVWHVHPLGTRWRRPPHQARIVLETSDQQAVGFSLGVLEVLRREHDEQAVAHLGPDLLGPDWDLEEAVRRLVSAPSRPTFLALLDQRNLAGFGNEYVHELLFLSGLDPWRAVGDVPALSAVVARGQRMLEANKDRVERSFTGSTRRGEQRWVHQRDGSPCRRCGTCLRSGRLGDSPTTERNVVWCPRCQR